MNKISNGENLQLKNNYLIMIQQLNGNQLLLVHCRLLVFEVRMKVKGSSVLVSFPAISGS
jgi:hypothetical protein